MTTVDENESDLLEAAMTGTFKVFSVGDDELDAPAQGANWGADRQIRAAFLIELLTAMRSPNGKSPRAVKLRGARITGSLDLEAATFTCPLLLWDCHIDEPVSFNEVTAPAIRMLGCHLPGLTASQLRTTGDLILGATVFTRTGEIQLNGARIGGSLALAGVTFRNPSGTALNADGLTVEQDMLCGSGFAATGEVRIVGAKIGGGLALMGATLTNPNPGGIAMSANGLTVGQNMSGDGLTAEGEILLFGATIGGDLNLRDAKLNLSCANLANPGRTALTADRITVGQGMHMDRLNSVGEVRLPGAHISGQLTLTGAKLNNPDGAALYASQLRVDSDMSCQSFTVAGSISLDSAQIGKQLYFTNATLTDPGMLTAVDLTVVRDFFANIGFTATGEVSLHGASIGGELNFNGACLANKSGLALDIGAASIQTLRMPQEHPEGAVDFTNAKVGVLVDDQDSWPTVLGLRGFAYDVLQNGHQNSRVDVQQRLKWLNRHVDGYVPEIYDQLSNTYRRAGQPDKARKVAIASQWRRRSPLNPFNWLLRWSVGYGYRNWLAAIWLAVILVAGTVAFSHTRMTATTIHPPRFNAFGYTVDTTVPIINLGQREAWQPQGTALYLSWALTGAGWILTTAAVAGLTGVLKRD
jgi:hypothetical protein